MSGTLRRRIERLEDAQHLRENPVLLVLVEPDETPEEAIERGCEGWGLPLGQFSMVLVLNMHGQRARV